MARHVAYRPSATRRALAPIVSVAKRPLGWHPVKRLLTEKSKKSISGFVWTAGLVAVSIVDPYSGAMANTMEQAYLLQMAEGSDLSLIHI